MSLSTGCIYRTPTALIAAVSVSLFLGGCSVSTGGGEEIVEVGEEAETVTDTLDDQSTEDEAQASEPEEEQEEQPDESLNNEGSQTGVLVDAAIEGIRYERNGVTGTTDEFGYFFYDEGEAVRFYIGDLFIAEVEGKDVITPLDFTQGLPDLTDPAVINLARLLQSLDADDDPDNGIDLSRLSNLQLSLTELPDFTDEVAVSELLSALDADKTLIEKGSALGHFIDQFLALGYGNVEGQVITGENGLSGTWFAELTVSQDGQGITVEDMSSLIYGAQVPNDLISVTASDAYMQLGMLAAQWDITNITNSTSQVVWQFQTPATVTPAYTALLTIDQISLVQPIFKGGNYTSDYHVWKHRRRSVHTVTPEPVLMGFPGEIEIYEDYLMHSGADIDDLSDQLHQDREFAEENDLILQTLQFVDTHHSEYFIPANMLWTRVLDKSIDDLQRTHSSYAGDYWSVYKHADHLKVIDQYATFIPTGSWSEVWLLNIPFGNNLYRNQQLEPVALSTVPTTLAGLQMWFMNEIGFELAPGTFSVERVAMTEDHISWDLKIYITDIANPEIKYYELDLDFVKQ